MDKIPLQKHHPSNVMQCLHTEVPTDTIHSKNVLPQMTYRLLNSTQQIYLTAQPEAYKYRQRLFLFNMITSAALYSNYQTLYKRLHS